MKKKRTLLIIPAVTGVLFVAALVQGGSIVGDKGMAAVANLVGNPLSIFDQRSPGARKGALLQTKHRYRSSPIERVAPGEAAPEAAAADPAVDAPEVKAMPFIVPQGSGDPVADPAPSSPGIATFSPPPSGAPKTALISPASGGGGVPVDPGTSSSGGPGTSSGGPGTSSGGPGSSTGGTSSGGPIITPPEPPIPSAVPEPATWLQMIVGMFAIGIALRHKARAKLRRQINASQPG